MKVKEITQYLESWAPKSLQESYDNSGLIVGDSEDEIKGALISLDVTESVLDEAIKNGSDLIIAHHPIVFSGIKKIGKTHWIDKCLRKAIKNDIAIYAIHTNLDNIITGVNKKVADKIGLEYVRILKPKSDTLLKLTVFVPIPEKDQFLNALFEAGAGKIGNYDHCSFQITGEGSFRPNEQANPTIGLSGDDESVNETRIEVMLPNSKKHKVLGTMRSAHPYEEVAYYLSKLENDNQEVGAGMIGELATAQSPEDFLLHLKKVMKLDTIKHTKLLNESVKRIALCGGSGRFLLENAITQKADIFISADFKYHDYFEANDQLVIADIGHYESEVFTKDLLYERLTKKFAKFAFRLSEVDTNPIKYL